MWQLMPMFPSNIGINCHFAGMPGLAGGEGTTWVGTVTGISEGRSLAGLIPEGSIPGGVTGTTGVGMPPFPGWWGNGSLGC